MYLVAAAGVEEAVVVGLVERLQRLVAGEGQLERNHRQNDQNEKIAVAVYLAWID